MGVLTERRYEQTDGFVTYQQVWNTNTGWQYSEESVKYSDETSAAANIAFTGTSIDLIALTGPNYGIASVTLDGGTPVNVDLYSASYAYQQSVWSASSLTDGPHTLRVEWTGSKNTSSTDTQINIDAVDLIGILTPSNVAVRYEDTDTHIAFSSAWTSVSGSSFSGDSFSYAATSTMATVRFEGTSIDLIALTGPNYGIASVTLDGGTPVNVDLYSASYAYQQSVWSASSLTDTAHTLEIQWTGFKNSSASDTRINIDAVEIAGRILQAN